MKISSSSSLLFATLAISSSNSSLAAPTGEGSQSDFAARSPRLPHAERHQPSYDNHVMMEHTPRQLEAVENLLNGLPIVGPIVGPLLAPILDSLGLHAKAGGASAASALDVEDMAQIEQAVAKASSAINAKLGTATQLLPVPVPTGVLGLLPKTPLTAREDEVSAEGLSVGSLPIQPGSILPATPLIPIAPPNTPSLPVGLPAVPSVPTGILPVAPGAIVGGALPGAVVGLGVSNMLPPLPPAVPSSVGNVPQAVLGPVLGAPSETMSTTTTAEESQQTPA